MSAELKPWRAEVVGSLLRPADLVHARKRLDSGEMTSAEFKAVEDEAVRSAIELQAEADIDVVTDGELRRYAFYGHLIDSFEGFDREGGWSVRPFVLAPPRNFDLDLRLSAGRLDVYGRELANAAASAILKDGVLTLSLIDAAAYGGRLRGETRVACVGDDVNVQARARLS